MAGVPVSIRRADAGQSRVSGSNAIGCWRACHPVSVDQRGIVAVAFGRRLTQSPSGQEEFVEKQFVGIQAGTGHAIWRGVLVGSPDPIIANDEPPAEPTGDWSPVGTLGGWELVTLDPAGGQRHAWLGVRRHSGQRIVALMRLGGLTGGCQLLREWFVCLGTSASSAVSVRRADLERYLTTVMHG
jgi:hypothetical protein